MSHGIALPADASPEIVATVAQEAESLGYDSVWVNHPAAFDALALLAAAAAVTERVDLGVGVAPLHRVPAAQLLANVGRHGLDHRRVLLGVGSANPQSLARVRDGVAELRQGFSGRIVVAALGPRMCRLAGEIADGVLFNWLTPDYARASGGWVAEGAAAAGRAVPELRTYVRVALGDAACVALAAEGARYAGVSHYGAHFERMGVEPSGTAITGGGREAVQAGVARWAGSGVHIELRAFTAGGTLEEYLAVAHAGAPD